MRSPKHLVISATVFAVVVTTIGLFIPRLTGANEPSGAAANTGGTPTSATARPGGAGGGTATTTPAPTSSLPTRITPTQTPTSAAPAPEALDVATEWAKAWVKHPEGTTIEQWLDGLRPFTTEEQLAVMGTVDLENIPATAVTGPAKATRSFTSSVEVAVPTDGGTLSITVIRSSVGWRVSHYERAA
jgi:hypothetical protein